MEEVSVFDQINDLQQYAAQDRDVLSHQEGRIQQLEAEVHELMETLQVMLNSQKEEKEVFKKKLSDLDGLQSKLRDVVHTAAEATRTVATLEKRMDNVKKDAFSGVATSVIVFSFILILSFFIR
ncbi:MAG: hypothetical protein HQL80_04940 [Magnetococcales bacterium]|nr:hypothetical protein [Magnetococcales bacterium]